MQAFHVKGIVKDFHSHSLHTLIQPMVILQQNPEKMSLLAIKTDGTNDKAVIKKLREMYNQIAPDEIFEVTYLTDQISNFYLYEKNQAKIIGAGLKGPNEEPSIISISSNSVIPSPIISPSNRTFSPSGFANTIGK